MSICYFSPTTDVCLDYFFNFLHWRLDLRALGLEQQINDTTVCLALKAEACDTLNKKLKTSSLVIYTPSCIGCGLV